jgi:hypothetical protein
MVVVPVGRSRSRGRRLSRSGTIHGHGRRTPRRFVGWNTGRENPWPYGWGFSAFWAGWGSRTFRQPAQWGQCFHVGSSFSSSSRPGRNQKKRSHVTHWNSWRPLLEQMRMNRNVTRSVRVAGNRTGDRWSDGRLRTGRDRTDGPRAAAIRPAERVTNSHRNTRHQRHGT